MSVDNVVYTVVLIELGLEFFDINPDRRVKWPTQINSQIIPSMDAPFMSGDKPRTHIAVSLDKTLLYVTDL
jgi:hypothetical protein